MDGIVGVPFHTSRRWFLPPMADGDAIHGFGKAGIIAIIW